MKKRYLSFLKRILVSALSLSMIIQPVSPVVAAEAGSEAIEIGSSEEELSGAAESAGAAAQQTDEAQVVTDASSAVESSVDDAAVDDARYEDVDDVETMDVASGEEEVVEDDTEPVEEEESSEEEAVTTAAEEDSDKAFVAHVYDVTKEAEEYETLPIGENTDKAGQTFESKDKFFKVHFHNKANTKTAVEKVVRDGDYAPLPDEVDDSWPLYRLNLNGAITFGDKGPDGLKRVVSKAIEFTTTSSKVTVKAWWSGNGLDREMAIYDEDQTEVTATNVNSGETAGVGPKGAGYGSHVTRLYLKKPGKYYVGWKGGANYLYKLSVLEGESEHTEAQWESVKAPVIKSVKTGIIENKEDKTIKRPGKIVVSLDTDIETEEKPTGAEEVKVYMAKVPAGVSAASVSADYIIKNAVIVNSVLKDNAEDPSIEVSSEFIPDSSAEYVFVAVAHRDNTSIATFTDKVSNTASIKFTRPLDSPVITAATNQGKGSKKVEVRFTPVIECDSYEVYLRSEDKKSIVSDKVIVNQPLEEGESVYKILVDESKLTLGNTAYACVVAKRNAENACLFGSALQDDRDVSVETAKQFGYRDIEEVAWEFAAYGTSVDKNYLKDVTTANCGYIDNPLNPKADTTESIRVWSVNGKGKIVPNTMDGVSFRYIAVPREKNFKISANVHVNDWSFSNGQDGFGVMAADRVGTPYDDDYWNNSFMAVATKSEYRWDGEDYTSDETYRKINMYLGVSALGRYGVTNDKSAEPGTDDNNLEEFEKRPATAMENWFTQDQTPLEHFFGSWGGGTYNLVANYVPSHSFNAKKMGPSSYGVGALRDGTANSAKAKKLEKSDFVMTVEKNNSGYFVTYYDPVSKKSETKKYYDPKYYFRGEPIAQEGWTEADWKKSGILEKKGLLETLSSKYVHAGFFAARNADITVSDIVFETWDPASGKKADGTPDVTEPQTPVYFDNNSGFTSAGNSNSEDYILSYMPTWKGDLEIVDDNNTVLFNGTVMPDVSIDIPVTLDVGSNTFKALFRTSPYAPGNAEGNQVYHYGYDYNDPDKRTENIHNELKDYADVSSKLNVNFRKYGVEGNSLYVTPSGKSTGRGTTASPLDIYTAIKYVMPGQQIILAAGDYKLNKTVRIERGINGTKDKKIKMMTDPNDFKKGRRAHFDFLRSSSGIVLGGDYWIIKNIEITNTADSLKGLQIAGSHNLVENLVAHHNGNNGIDVSRLFGSDLSSSMGLNGEPLWPHDNLILNCTSYENSDNGYEDADGYACKLTVGEGNVFDGCIAYLNADDGWDLYAKSETGEIGRVVIKNSVAYKNGYLHRDKDGDGVAELIKAGNGNGFKMGGEALPGKHTLINSFSFMNKAKGIDSNSCPDIRAYNCVTFDNESYNIAMYTNNQKATDYQARNVVSFRKNVVDSITDSNGNEKSPRDQLYLDGGKSEAQAFRPSVFTWNLQTYTGGEENFPNGERVNGKKTSMNSEGVTISENSFKSLDFDIEKDTIGRNADGSVNMGDFLQLKDEVYDALPFTSRIEIGAALPSDLPEDDVDILDSSTTANTAESSQGLKITAGSIIRGANDSDSSSALTDFDDVESIVPVKDTVVVGTPKDQYFTGYPIIPNLLITEGMGDQMRTLKKGTDYTVRFEKNINPGPVTVKIFGIGRYTGWFKNDEGTDVTFNILPISLTIDEKTGKGQELDVYTRKGTTDSQYKIHTEVIDADREMADEFKGKPLTPIPVITQDIGYATRKLSAGKDFTVEYYKAGAAGEFVKSDELKVDKIESEGQYYILVRGTNALEDEPAGDDDIISGTNRKRAGNKKFTGNYSGWRTIKYHAYAPGSMTAMKKVKLPKIPAQKLENIQLEGYEEGNRPFNLTKQGRYVDSAAELKEGEELMYPIEGLTLGTDYKVTYYKNTRTGNATANIIGIGDKYCGAVKKKFKIKAVKFITKGKNVTVSFNVALARDKKKRVEFDYTGSSDDINGAYDNALTVYYVGTDNAGLPVTRLLSNGPNADYIIVPKRTGYTGTATMLIKGTGAYKGMIVDKCWINPLGETGMQNSIKDGRMKIVIKGNYSDGKDEIGKTYPKYFEKSGSYYRFYQKDDGKVDIDIRFRGRKLTEGKDYRVNFPGIAKHSLGEQKIQIYFQKTFAGKLEGDTYRKNSPWYNNETVDGVANDNYNKDPFCYQVLPGEFSNNTAFVKANDIIWKSSRTKAKIPFTVYEYETKSKMFKGRDYNYLPEFEYDSDVYGTGDNSKEIVKAKGTKIQSGEGLAEPDADGYSVLVKVISAGDRYGEGQSVSTAVHVAKNNIARVRVMRNVIKTWNTYDPGLYTGVELDRNDWNKLLKDSDGTYLTYGKDFVVDTTYDYSRHVKDVKLYHKNQRNGRANVEIRGLGKYAGSKRIYFSIVPKNFNQKVTGSNADPDDSVQLTTKAGKSSFEVDEDMLTDKVIGGKLTVAVGNKFTLTGAVKNSFKLEPETDAIDISKAGEVTVKGIPESGGEVVPVALSYMIEVDGNQVDEEGKEIHDEAGNPVPGLVQRQVVLNINVKQFGFEEPASGAKWSIDPEDKTGMTIIVPKKESVDAVLTMQNAVFAKANNDSVINNLSTKLDDKESKIHIKGTARRAGTVTIPVTVNNSSYTITIKVPEDEADKAQ